MKSKDAILGLTADELDAKLIELHEEMGNLQLQQATHQITNPLRIRLVRRDIARTKTLISEFKNGTRKAIVEEK
jgi:large subunit ribosomal protein L29